MDARHTVAEALRSFRTAMMVTHTQSGPFDVRPMYVAAVEMEAGGPIWFITSVDHHAATEVSGDHRTLLVFQEQARQDAPGVYLAVWGTARLVDDRPRLRRLWRDPFLEWFPTGADAPDLRLIAVTPHSAELWRHGTDERVRYVLEPLPQHARTNV
jgi:general stress protein 26